MCDVPKKMRVRWAIIQDYKDAKKEMLRKLAAANDDLTELGDGLGFLPDSDIQVNLQQDKGVAVTSAKKVTEKKFAELKEKKRKYKKAEKRSAELYCCYCGGRHMHTSCRDKPANSGRAHDMNIRKKADSGTPSHESRSSGSSSYKKLFEKYRSNDDSSYYKRKYAEKTFDADREDTDEYNDRVFREFSKGSRYHKKGKY